MITNKRAKEIAAEWHSGQFSRLYGLACGTERKDTDCFTPSHWRELYRELLEEQNRDIQDKTPAGYKALKALRHWVYARAGSYGMAYEIDSLLKE